MTTRRSSLSNRMAIFEQNIANNTKHASSGNGGSFLSNIASKTARSSNTSTPPVLSKASSVDNVSVGTMPTVSTRGSYRKEDPKTSLSSSNKPVPRNISTHGSADHDCDMSTVSHGIHTDLVSLSELRPRLNGEPNDSLNSAISLIDLAEEEEEQAEETTNLMMDRFNCSMPAMERHHKSSTRLSLGPRVSSFPMNGRRSSIGGAVKPSTISGDSGDLHALMSMLDQVMDDGKPKKKDIAKKSRRRASLL